MINYEEENSKSNKNQSAKNRNKENSNSNNVPKTRPMHIRSSSVSVPSSSLLNHNNMNGNYQNNSNYNNPRENLNNNNLNNTILKSKVKIVDKDLRSSSNLGNNMGINASSTLRGGIGSYHKHTQSYNNIYGNLIQSNSNFSSSKLQDKSAEKKSTPLLQHDSSKSIKMLTGRLPNINSIDKSKLQKMVNSSSSNLLFKYYKQQSSINSNNSTGASLTNQIFGKKNMAVTGVPFSNLNH